MMMMMMMMMIIIIIIRGLLRTQWAGCSNGNPHTLKGHPV